MEHPSPFTSCYGDMYFWHSWMTELLLKTAIMIFLSASQNKKISVRVFFALFSCLSWHLVISLCLAKSFLSSQL